MIEVSETTKTILEEVETLIEEGLTKQQVWEQLQSSNLTDTELDQLVGLLEENGNKEMAEEIALGIHTPTLQGDILRSAPWHSNDYCNNADHQQPLRRNK